MGKLFLKPGREKSLRRRHPWVFSGAIARIEGTPGPGDTVAIHGADGRWLARGAYSPRSQIAVRVWSFEQDEEIAPAFFQRRLEMAIRARARLVEATPRPAIRLVNAESDGLPGLIVDRYDDFWVCQFLSAGAEAWRGPIAQTLEELTAAKGIFERSDVDIRQKEGLAPRSGVLAGEAPPPLVEIGEGPCRFWVDIANGHKTGFYLDQRDSRRRLAAYAKDRAVLNCFAYTGGFGLSALKAGAAHVTNVEASASAIELAERNAELNGIEQGLLTNLQGDVFQVLRQFRTEGRRFDLIVLDPPKFVESRGHLERGARGYKDINLLAFQLLEPGGLLFSFSCSGLLPPDLFQKIVADAALDAAREAQIIGHLHQAEDHPVALSFPEGAYLKGLICRAF